MIASIVKHNSIKLDNKHYIGKSNIMYDLCDMFKHDNNNFDEHRFIDACNDD